MTTYGGISPPAASECFCTLQLAAASKTVVFSFILKSLAARGKRGLMVVHGRHLVDQAAARLEREGVPHGVIMAGRTTRLGQPVYVCSIDTLRARGLKPAADLVVIDEAHMATSKSYHDFLAAYADAYILAVTATPYTAKPLRHLADVVVAPITVADLTTQGFLVPPRYVVPVDHDLSGVKVASTGDYDTSALADFMGKSRLVGDLVDNWVRFGERRPTLCFAPTIELSRGVVDRCAAAGIPALHVEADTPEAERRDALARLERGDVKVVSNVGILCTGVDLPFVSCLLMYRPTKSLSLWIQQAGRGTRPAPGKSDFIVIDHANNVRQHGFIDLVHEVFLDGMPKAKRGAPNPVPIKVCPSCYAANRAGDSLCIRCGFAFVADKSRAPEQVDGDLAEIGVDNVELRAHAEFQELKRIQKARGYKRGWLYFQLAAKYGEDVADRLVPRRNVPDWVRARNTPGS